MYDTRIRYKIYLDVKFEDHVKVIPLNFELPYLIHKGDIINLSDEGGIEFYVKGVIHFIKSTLNASSEVLLLIEKDTRSPVMSDKQNKRQLCDIDQNELVYVEHLTREPI